MFYMDKLAVTFPPIHQLHSYFLTLTFTDSLLHFMLITAHTPPTVTMIPQYTLH